MRRATRLQPDNIEALQLLQALAGDHISNDSGAPLQVDALFKALSTQGASQVTTSTSPPHEQTSKSTSPQEWSSDSGHHAETETSARAEALKARANFLL